MQMKQLQRPALVVLAIAMMGLIGSSGASATVLEVGGGVKTEPIELKASLQAKSSARLATTSGETINTCTSSSLEAKDSTHTSGIEVSGPVSSLSFSGCTREKVIVDTAGSLSVSWISGTTNGTVRSSGAKITVPTALGTATCTTENTDLGTLTGVAFGPATIDIQAVVNCGALYPSARWEATYVVTSPEGLGVSGSAPADTTLEIAGAAKNESVAVKASLSGSAVLKDTSNIFANTCTSSTVEGSTAAPYSSSSVGGPVSALSFGSCTHEKVVVDKAGSLSVEWISGSTNGTVRSSGAEVTVPVTIFGSVVTATCKTENTDLGKLTGTASGTATVDVNAVLNCGSFLPSAKWEGTYVVTSPEGLGVIS
jgi:hypothetical protein